MSQLLLPYRLRAAAADAPYHRLTLTVGEAVTAEPLRCGRILVRLPLATPALDGDPVCVQTTTDPVHGAAQGRAWRVLANTTDPAAVTFALVPDCDATFDGSWTAKFTLDVDHALAGTADITEETGAGTLTARTDTITAEGTSRDA
ncbi:hypothetical protein [Streptomyces sp. NRRL S-1448]|uniref:hypothetical protein n=1 Tax=Streptomyces sp. NRRL S-1448 TaxID=1463883 RepID=UPI0004BEE9AD|nr:hypothetical protein [Streptomyces sp. NRRL S-1448]